MGKGFIVVGIIVIIIASASMITWQSELSTTTDVRATSTPKTLLEYAKETHDLINEQRMLYGLKPLAWNDDLAEAAKKHSWDMARTGIFNHGSRFCNGENIAFSSKWMTPQEAVNTWMKSQGHQNNILDPRWNESGIGIAMAEAGKTYYTQNFAIDSTQC